MEPGKNIQVILGPFQNGVAVLRQGTAVAGHVATIVEPFRGLLLLRGTNMSMAAGDLAGWNA
jgi:hypothetical protein